MDQEVSITFAQGPPSKSGGYIECPFGIGFLVLYYTGLYIEDIRSSISEEPKRLACVLKHKLIYLFACAFDQFRLPCGNPGKRGRTEYEQIVYRNNGGSPMGEVSRR